MIRKLYLIGLDGFNSALFQVLSREGVMPQLTGLIKKGIWGPLRSTRPPYTGPAWVTMFTGVNPGRHGIYGFTGPRSDSYERYLRNASKIGAERIWGRLNRAGLSVGLVNVPFTYPPSPIHGFMVSGMLTPNGSENYFYPESVRRIIDSAVDDYLIDVPLDLEKDWRSVEICRRLEKSLVGRVAVLNALLKTTDPDFLMTVFVLPDRVQHLWYRIVMQEEGWREGDFSREVRKKVFNLFRRLDEAIGSLAGRLGKDDIIIIASDHGFTSFRHTFYLNSLLVEAGYLRLKKGGGILSALAGFLNRSGLKKRLPRSLIRAGKLKTMKESIDWSSTLAYASPGMEEGIIINLRGRQPGGIVNPGADYDNLRREIRDNLIRGQTQERILKNVIFREDIYRGDYLESAPDLILDFASDGWNMRGSLVGKDISRSYDGVPYGTHQSQGFWAATGGGIKESSEPFQARIEDITPTILNLFGLPSPASLDGRPIEAVVSPVLSDQEKEPIIKCGPAAGTGYSPEDQAEIERRLEGLGYV